MNKRLIFALAGLQTGVSGALGMLVFLALGSLWTKHSIWWVPNLIASSLYGRTSVRNGIGIHTAAGIAIALCFYALTGMVFGEMVGERRGGFRLFCVSMLVALTVDWALLRWFWKMANPLGHVYAPDGQILFAHLLFGCFLATYPGTRRRLSHLSPSARPN